MAGLETVSNRQRGLRRTGLVAMLILSCCGTSAHEIISDYARRASCPWGSLQPDRFYLSVCYVWVKARQPRRRINDDLVQPATPADMQHSLTKYLWHRIRRKHQAHAHLQHCCGSCPYRAGHAVPCALSFRETAGPAPALFSCEPTRAGLTTCTIWQAMPACRSWMGSTRRCSLARRQRCGILPQCQTLAYPYAQSPEALSAHSFTNLVCTPAVLASIV